jgi:hypothetical protein
MHYTKLTLGHKVFKVHVANRRVMAVNILQIQLIPNYVGPSEELSLKDSVVLLSMRNGTEYNTFGLDDQGNIVDEDKVYFFNVKDAEAECAKLK